MRGIEVIVGIIVIISPKECWIAGCGGRRRVRVGVVISGRVSGDSIEDSVVVSIVIDSD